MPFMLLLKCKTNSILIIMIINNGNTKHGKTSLGRVDEMAMKIAIGRIKRFEQMIYTSRVNHLISFMLNCMIQNIANCIKDWNGHLSL